MMLKFAFAVLLLVNLLLAALQSGMLEPLVPSGHEPQRLKSQINAERIRLLTPATPATQPNPVAAGAAIGTATATAPPTAPNAATATSATPDQQAQSCVEVGNLTLAQAKQFESQLAAIPLAQKPVRRELREESSHMVWLAPQGGRAGADRRAAELRTIGINDFFVLQDNPEQRYGISLGVFKTEEAARAQLARLTQQGVRGASMIDYKMPLTRVAFELRGLDAKARQALDRQRAKLARHELRDCGTS